MVRDFCQQIPNRPSAIQNLIYFKVLPKTVFDFSLFRTKIRLFKNCQKFMAKISLTFFVPRIPNDAFFLNSFSISIKNIQDISNESKIVSMKWKWKGKSWWNISKELKILKLEHGQRRIKTRNDNNLDGNFVIRGTKSNALER